MSPLPHWSASLQLLRTRRSELAAAAWTLQRTLFPEVREKYSGPLAERCLGYTTQHLSYLYESLMVLDKSLFLDYIEWVDTLLRARGASTADLAGNLLCLRDTLARELPPDLNRLVADYLEEAVVFLNRPDPGGALPDPAEKPMRKAAARYLELVLAGDRAGAQAWVQELRATHTTQEIYLQVFQESQYHIGQLWHRQKITVAQEHYCTGVTQELMAALMTGLLPAERRGPVLVAWCTGGELHDMGIRMVTDFFAMEGWQTYRLGANTPVRDAIRMATDLRADLVAISATMTYHVSQVREAITQLRAHPSGGDLPVLVGGYPFLVSPALWKNVGASGFAANAREALLVAGVVRGEGSKVRK